MSKRDARLFISDMLDAIEKVERYTAGLSYEDFQQTDMIIDAVVRNPELSEKQPGISRLKCEKIAT